MTAASQPLHILLRPCSAFGVLRPFNSPATVLFVLSVLQDQVDAAVKQLLALKTEFKKQTGQDYKPGLQAPGSQAQTQSTKSGTPAPAEELFSQITQQGERVRKLKSEKAPKVMEQIPVDFHVPG